MILYAVSREQPTISSTFDTNDPDTIQGAIAEIQKKNTFLYPIDTVYYGSSGGKIIFLDTQTYAGVEYTFGYSESGEITNIQKNEDTALLRNPFSSFVKPFKIGNLDIVAPTPDMKAIWTKYTVEA